MIWPIKMALSGIITMLFAIFLGIATESAYEPPHGAIKWMFFAGLAQAGMGILCGVWFFL